MWNFWILLLSVIPLTLGKDSLYQLYNGDTKSLEYFCGNFYGTMSDVDSSREFLTKSSEVMELKIGGCDNETVARAIEKCPNVRLLDISYSGYYTLGSVHLKANYLEKLDVSHNPLMNIPWFFFKQIPKLTELDFSYNKLERINSYDFEGANELMQIDLSHNMINLISYSAFENLKNLEYVDLSNNLIGYGIEAFQNNNNLKVLHLEHNPLWSLTCDYFLNINPLSVLISFKYLQLINLSCDGITVEVMMDDKVEGIFSTTKGQFQLHCDENSFSNVHTFNSERIRIENASKLMQSFRSIITLSLSDSFIGQLNTTTIHRLTELRELSMKRTNLTHFDVSMLENQHQLKIIDISYNQLKRLNHISLLDSLDHLTQFLAVENEFEHVDEIIHRLPTSIESLDLSGNVIGYLDSASISKFKNLIVLNLSNTNLSIAVSNPFDELKELSILDVSDNDLSHTDFSTLATTLKQIAIFYATNCQIRNISNVIQYFGPSLARLHLSGNFVGDLNVNIFDGFSELQYLYLDNTNISTFQKQSLRHQKKLIELNIANNKLRHIDFSHVSGKLTTLYLQGNDLVAVKNLTKLRFPLIVTLDIANNRLACDVLSELVREWDGTFINDPWTQKDDTDCRRQT